MSDEDRPIKNLWGKKFTSIFSKPPQSKKEVINCLLQESLLDSQEKGIIDGALNLSELQVADILIPRPQMVSIKADDKLEDFLPALIDSAHSWFPVFGESSDKVVGILIAKDLLKILTSGDETNVTDFNVQDYLRPAVFVTEYTKLDMMLTKFRETRQHMAIVVDEYGGVDGLITLEDILEQLVGDIEDEHDTEEDEEITVNKDGSFTISALMPIEDCNQYLHSNYSNEDFDTIGGIIVHEFGHLPHKGESIQIGNFNFLVTDADNRRLHEVKATKIKEDN